MLIIVYIIPMFVIGAKPSYELSQKVPSLPAVNSYLSTDGTAILYRYRRALCIVDSDAGLEFG